jgi:hypothetical protein
VRLAILVRRDRKDQMVSRENRAKRASTDRMDPADQLALRVLRDQRAIRDQQARREPWDRLGRLALLVIEARVVLRALLEMLVRLGRLGKLGPRVRREKGDPQAQLAIRDQRVLEDLQDRQALRDLLVPLALMALRVPQVLLDL